MKRFLVKFEDGHQLKIKAESKDDIKIFDKISEYLDSKNCYVCANTGYTANEIKYSITQLTTKVNELWTNENGDRAILNNVRGDGKYYTQINGELKAFEYEIDAQWNLENKGYCRV